MKCDELNARILKFRQLAEHLAVNNEPDQAYDMIQDMQPEDAFAIGILIGAKLERHYGDNKNCFRYEYKVCPMMNPLKDHE